MNKITPTTTRNKSFWAKSKPQQRIAIAKDVLKQISNKFYTADSGTYFEIIDLYNKIKKPPAKLDQLFTLLKSEGATCDVCGIGSCFVSLVNLGDKAKTKEFINDYVEGYAKIDDDDMRPLLRKVFSPQQLSLIESAFETSDFRDNDDKQNDLNNISRAIRFGRRYISDKNRLIGIMKNIIKNKGEFHP